MSPSVPSSQIDVPISREWRAGTYLVRVQVDGAESPLDVDSQGAYSRAHGDDLMAAGEAVVGWVEANQRYSRRGWRSYGRTWPGKPGAVPKPPRPARPSRGGRGSRSGSV